MKNLTIYVKRWKQVWIRACVRCRFHGTAQKRRGYSEGKALARSLLREDHYM